MKTRIAHELSFSSKAFLAFAAKVALASSLSVGVVNAISGGSQVATTSQNSTEAKAAFEFASVRLFDPKAGTSTPLSNPNCVPARGIQIDGRRFAITASPYYLISIAYGKLGSDCRRMSDLFVGGPEWIRLDQYDIEAIVPEGSPNFDPNRFANRDGPTLQLMLQTLLADCFKLKVHRETKDFSVYMLTVANSAKLPTATQGLAGPSWLSRRLDQNGQPYGELRAERAPILSLVVTLQGIVGEPVQDKTGLTGRFDVTLEFDNNGIARPTLAAALQEIGLKLEAAKVPMEVLVIDSVERPPQN